MSRHMGCSLFYMQEAGIECVFHTMFQFFPFFCIGFQSLQAGKTMHQLQHFQIIGSGDQRTVSLAGRILTVNQFQRFGRNTPVTIFIFSYDIFLCHIVFTDMSHPFFDSRIILLYRTFISEIGKKHITSHRQRRGPSHIVRVIVPIGRSDIGNTTVFTLCFADITCPFGIHCIIIEKHTLSPTSHGAVAQPRLTFIPLRTVYRHTFIITPDSPKRITDNLIQCLVRATERSCMRHLVFHDFSYEVSKLRIRIIADLHITEAMIHETRCPRSVLHFASAYDIRICGTGVT